MSRRWPILRAIRMKCPRCPALVRLTSEILIPWHKDPDGATCEASGDGGVPDFETGTWGPWRR